MKQAPTSPNLCNGALLFKCRTLYSGRLLLRRTKLKESHRPRSVLRGDMSLVGARPLQMEYLDHYSLDRLRRHEVRPSITGWAQINGRNAIGWEQKIACDTWYVDHWSYWLDFRIPACTISRVLRGTRVSHGDTATMPRFLGQEPEDQ